MVKNNQSKIKSLFKALLLLLVSSLFIVACDKDEVGLPEIKSVRSTDPAKADSTFTNSLPGNWIIIEGKNFDGLQSVSINETEVYINSSFVTNEAIVLQIPSDIPTLATNASVSNKIKLVTATGECVYDFIMMISPPVVYSLSNEMAPAGEKLYISGANFYVIDSIIFPGGVIVSSGFEINDGANLIAVTVPEGITEGGAVVVKNVFGRALSPGDFNSKKGLLCNFDDKNTYIWGSTVLSNDGTYPGASGQFNQMKSDDVGPGSYDWWSNFKCCSIDSSLWISPENMTDNIADWAIKFELFVAKPWNSGCLLLNANNGWVYTARYAPWVVNEERTDFQTSGWITVSIPLNEFRTKGTADGNGLQAKSLANLVTSRGTAFLTIMFINDAQQGIDPKLISIDFGIDNIRVVKLAR